MWWILGCGTTPPPYELAIDHSSPMVTVTIVAPGAAPEVVERTITTPTEAVLGSISGVEEVVSSSADSIATLTVTFAPGTKPPVALQAVRDALRLPGLVLPPGAEARVDVASSRNR